MLRVNDQTRVPQLLSAKDIAERLSCSKRHAARILSCGEMPVVRLGGIVRVREADLAAYVKRHTTPTVGARVMRLGAAPSPSATRGRTTR